MKVSIKLPIEISVEAEPEEVLKICDEFGRNQKTITPEELEKLIDSLDSLDALTDAEKLNGLLRILSRGLGCQ